MHLSLLVALLAVCNLQFAFQPNFAGLGSSAGYGSLVLA